MSRRNTKKRKTQSKRPVKSQFLPDKWQTMKIKLVVFYDDDDDHLLNHTTLEIRYLNDEHLREALTAFMDRAEKMFLKYLRKVVAKDKKTMISLIQACADDMIDRVNTEGYRFKYSEIAPSDFLESLETFGFDWYSTQDLNDDVEVFQYKHDKDNFFKYAISDKEITLQQHVEQYEGLTNVLQSIVYSFFSGLPNLIGYDAIKRQFYSPTVYSKMRSELIRPEIAGRDVGNMIYLDYLG